MAPGEGTGFGPAVVKGIVESHGGLIRARSEPGVGTTFFVMPRYSEQVDEEMAQQYGTSEFVTKHLAVVQIGRAFRKGREIKVKRKS